MLSVSNAARNCWRHSWRHRRTAPPIEGERSIRDLIDATGEGLPRADVAPDNWPHSVHGAPGPAIVHGLSTKTSGKGLPASFTVMIICAGGALLPRWREIGMWA